MTNVVKITSPIGVKNKIHNIPKQDRTDVIFDLGDKSQINKAGHKIDGLNIERQRLKHSLNRQMLRPLFSSTNVLTHCLRRFINQLEHSKLFHDPNVRYLLDKILIQPDELIDELLMRNQDSTIFKGEFFDSLRLLAQYQGEPKLRQLIIQILKYYDCCVNRANSLNAIINLSKHLAEQLDDEVDRQLLLQQINRIQGLGDIKKDEALSFIDKELLSFIKNDYISLLSRLVKKYSKIKDDINAIVHHITRFDKSDINDLKEAVANLGKEMMKLTNLKDEDISEMIKLILDNVKTERENIADENLTTLLAKTTDQSDSNEIDSIARNLLTHLLHNESPLFSLLHFVVPFRFSDGIAYVEFFIDKGSRETKGKKQAKTIFFTIELEGKGTFEVELIADKYNISLDIKCPEAFLDSVKNKKAVYNNLIRDHGYVLSSFLVDVYKESQSVIQRFPKLESRKAGLDVRI